MTVGGNCLASEAGLACVEHAFTELKLDRLIAAVEPANLPSVRVIEKCDFVQIARRPVSGKDAFLYELEHSDWLPFQI